MNTMTINGYDAVISYDAEIRMFRGEFISLNGGADFYAKDVDGLYQEGELSLKVFLDMCREEGVEPRKHFSGKFNLRVPPALHERLAVQAAAHGKSINAWVLDLLAEQVGAHAN
jgi:predicted HicB family RNase H-like nuclease